MTENDVATPALVVDVARARRNMTRLVEYLTPLGIAMRPHAKTHKSLRMAKMQLDAGARGLTVAKVGEAEVLATICNDIMIAYPALDPARTTRIAELAKKITVRVAVDSQLAVDALAKAASAAGVTVGILVDLDLGAKRTGVQTVEQALDLAKCVDQAGGVRLDGLFYYPGHVRDQFEQKFKPLAATLNQTIELWRAHGLAATIVSGGSTPSQYWTHLLPMTTEIRPGNGIYFDRNALSIGYCTQHDCAANIITTVVSNTVPGKVVLDAGSKTLTSDLLLGATGHGGYGLIEQYPEAVINNLSEEHGEVDVSNCAQPPKLGERVSVIPNHICVAVNMQTFVYFKDDNGELERGPVDTRGMLS